MANKYKNLLITTAISLAAVTSVVAVGATANGNALNVIANEPSRSSSRTLTINSEKRWVNLFANGGSEWSTVAYQMSNKSSYGLIKTTQTQELVYTNKDNCIFSLWDNGQDFGFQINPTVWDSVGIAIQGIGQRLDVVKYNHLTQIDFTLDKGNATGSDRTYDISSDIGNFEFVSEPAEQNTKIYRWTPNNAEGYISNQVINFSLNYKNNDNRGIWVLDMTFHYDC